MRNSAEFKQIYETIQSALRDYVSGHYQGLNMYKKPVFPILNANLYKRRGRGNRLSCKIPLLYFIYFLVPSY